MKKELIIENNIEIRGEDVLFESLSEEKQKEIGNMICERLMEAAGYKRKTA